MSDKWEQAYKDYLGDMKYADIAEKYDVSVGTVKSWASRYNWKKVAQKNKKVAKKGCTERSAKSSKNVNDIKGCKVEEGTDSQNSSSNTQHSKARFGNQNAAGNKGGKGGPHGNNYRHVHGLHSLLSPTTLTDAEAAHFLAKGVHSFEELEASVRICDILIARHMNKIEEFREKEKIARTLTEKIVTVKGIEKGQESDYIQKDIEKSHIYTSELIDKLHGEITKQVKIKAGLLKDIEDLQMKKAEFELKKKAAEKIDDQAADDDFIAAVLGNKYE